MKLVNRLLRGAAAVALLLAALPGWANNCFVKPDNVANGNGSSWSSPMPLANALSNTSCTVVYVAGGVYKTYPAGHPEYSFVVRSGTKIYGGFFGVPGTEMDMSQRDLARNSSVLSGDTNNDDTRGNTYLLGLDATQNPVTQDTVLDGITIENSVNGVLCYGSAACSPTITECVFVNNGQAIKISDTTPASNPIFRHLTFRNNSSGVLFVPQDMSASQLLLTDSTSEGSSQLVGAPPGGFNASFPSWDSYSVILSNVTVDLKGVGFGLGRGAIDVWGANVRITNSTITNSAFYEAMPNSTIFANGKLSMSNVILWNSPENAHEYGAACANPPCAFIENSILRDGCVDWHGNPDPSAACSNIITAAPGLGALQDNGGLTPTMLPLPGSLAIDAGNDSVCAANNVDQRGVPRPQGAHCDIGAVEAHLAALNVGVTGGGSVSASAPVAQYGGIANCTSAGGVACSAIYAGEPAVVTLNAAVPPDQVVTWGGACHSSSATATATLSGNPTTCTATFGIPTVWTVQTANEAASLTSNDCSLIAPGPGGVCSTLRDAMNRAQNGDVIRFTPTLDDATIALTLFSNAPGCTTDGPTQCAPGSPAGSHLTTQFGPSAFFISSKSITIDAVTGLTHGVTIARDTDPADYPGSPVAAPAFRLFDIDSSGGLNLYGVTLRNGLARGGSANFSAGGALGAGGAIFSQGSLAIDRCTFAENAALGGDSSGSSLGAGGAGVGQDAPLTLNGAGPNGGAFDWQFGYQRNGGFGGGGAVTLAPQGNSIGGNGGFGGGGGNGQPNGDGNLGVGGNGGFGGGAGGGAGTHSNAVNGSPGFGGGDYDLAPTSGGAGAGMGGAIFNDAGALVATNSTFAGNTATGGGNDPRSAAAYGGAVFNYAGSAEFGFVTLYGNRVAAALFGGVVPSRAQAEGGAIYSLADSLAGCSAGGNPCVSGDAKLIFNNSIAAGSTRLNNTDASIAATGDIVVNAINGGTASSSGIGNIVMANTGFAGTVTSSADPQLASLPPGGGLVGMMLPAASSPAINAAANCGGANGVDQGGLARPQGMQCDVGAAELELELAFVGSPADIGPGDRLGPLQVQLQDAAGHPVSGDFSTEVTLSTQACGGSVVLGRANVSAGVATFEGDTSPVFYTPGVHALTASATNLADASAQVEVNDAGADFVFADGFEGCRL